MGFFFLIGQVALCFFIQEGSLVWKKGALCVWGGNGWEIEFLILFSTLANLEREQ